MRIARLLGFAAVLLSGGAAAVPAQVLGGRVVEAGSGQPIEAATIHVIAAGAIALTTQTDSTGAFLTALPRSGGYSIRVERLGYAPAQSDAIAVGAGEVVQVVIRLGITALPLAPLLVVERRSAGAAPEFYRRVERGRRSGLGVFLTRVELESASTGSITTLLTRMPLLSVTKDASGKGLPMMISRGYTCVPTFYLNGAPLDPDALESLDDILTPTGLEGVEIYRNHSELPMEFAAEGECGAIALWTRTGVPARGGLWRYVAAGGALAGLVVWFFVN